MQEDQTPNTTKNEEPPKATGAPTLKGEMVVADSGKGGTQYPESKPDAAKDDEGIEQPVDDKEIEAAFVPEEPTGIRARLKRAWHAYWARPRAKLYTAAGLAVLSGLLVAIPPSRYFLLNNVGVRSSASITILDETNQQPLKNVSVSLRGQTATTGSDGKVQFSHVKLGRTKLGINRRAFAALEKTVTLGWGSNPLGSVQLKAVGAQFSLTITDGLSNKPIAAAEVSSNDLEAVADKDGNAILTVDTAKEQQLEVIVRATGYRQEKVALGNDSNTQKVALTSVRKQPFISNRSGKYDLYKIDVDGKNEEMVLKATGYEQAEMGLVTHPTEDIVAFVATRDNVRNKDNFLLSTLLFIDLSDNSSEVISHAERIQVLGWTGSKLVFAQITSGASASSPNRQRLMAYDYKTSKTVELAASNSFNDLALIGNTVYYAPSNAYTPNAPGGFYKITADATNKQTLLNKEVWNIFRADYSTLNLSVQQEWYQYKISSAGQATKLSAAPGGLKNRVYVDSVDGNHSLWLDERDGKGTLLLFDTKNATDKVVKTQAGLSSPVRWLDNTTLVYRIHTPQETADYVLNIEGGEAKKIRDVIHTDGVDRWYYY